MRDQPRELADRHAQFWYLVGVEKFRISSMSAAMTTSVWTQSVFDRLSEISFERKLFGLKNIPSVLAMAMPYHSRQSRS